jgi:hypothetical protein
MNPITRMMKRYIKTPLKYALPLLFIGSLALVSISGCTSSTSSNQAAGNTSQAASTTANITTSASASASATPTATPSPTPSSQPTTKPVTGSFGQSSYIVANATVITATVSNWASNPTIGIGTANGGYEQMQPTGNGGYSYTMWGVVIYAHGSGTGGISLVDNGKIVAYATTIWSNPTPTPTPTVIR